MRWRILAVGKPSLPYARDGIAEYLGRLKHFAPVEVDSVKASTRDRESAQLLARSEDCYRIVLDERGKTFTSRGLADRISEIQRDAHKTCALLVGGADGHTPALRASAHLTWSLTPLTLQHDLALLVTLEQLYRAHTILAGLPYHRD